MFLFSGSPASKSISRVSSLSALSHRPASRVSSALPAGKVVFNFVHNGASHQQTVSRHAFHCPWCGRDCLHVGGLARHLRSSHPRFSFQFLVCPLSLCESNLSWHCKHGLDSTTAVVDSPVPQDLDCMGPDYSNLLLVSSMDPSF